MTGAAEEPEPRPPLAGVRVVVTRAKGQAEDFARVLGAAGAEVLIRPLIRLEEPVDPEPLAQALRRLDSYDWIIFTSANGVGRFVEALKRGPAWRQSARPQVAAVGPVTAAALERAGIAVQLVPAEHRAVAIAQALASQSDLRGAHVLWPRASGAAAELPRALENEGARVDAIEAYRTVADTAAATDLIRELATRRADVLTFTSPSAVRAFVEAGGAAGDVCVAVLGPVTAAEAKRRRLRVDVEAAEQTVAGLTRAIGLHAARQRWGGRASRGAGGGVSREGPDHG